MNGRSENGDGDAENDDDEMFYIGTRKLTSDGRITIPAERLGVEEHDVVDVIAETEAGKTCYALDRPIESQNRVSIPHHQRELYEIEAGDDIHVTIRDTGMRVEENSQE